MKGPRQQASVEALRKRLEAIARLEHQGKLDEAVTICDELLEANPASVPLLVFKARLFRQQGEFRQAGSAIAEAAGLAPDSVAVLAEQGKLALAEGDADAARRCFESVTRVRPGHAEGWFNLGHACERSHRQQEAVAAYRKALTLGISAPEEVETRLGSLLTAMGKEAEALEHFDRALAIDAGNSQALYGKGMVQQALGDFVAAERLFLAALDANPDFVEVYQQLAELRRFDDPEDAIARRMRGLLETPRPSHSEEKLHFALGKIANDCGLYDTAFEHYRKANELKKMRLPPCERDDYKRLTDSVMSWFDHARMASIGDFATRAGAIPVFIVGMPRSGTTLVEQILSSHSQLGGAGELAFMDGLARHRIADYPHGLSSLGQDDLEAIRQAYLEEIAEHTRGHRYVTDKYPGNFLHLGLISTLFPEALFIHCRRDAMDNCLSIYFQDFGTGNYYTNDLEDIAFYYRRHDALMAHWNSLLGGRLLTVHYERVVAAQESETRRLLEFLSLDWEEACLAFEKNPRKVSTLSRWQVRQPIYKTAAGRWRRYRHHLDGLAAALDYPDPS